MLNNSLDNFLA